MSGPLGVVVSCIADMQRWMGEIPPLVEDVETPVVCTNMVCTKTGGSPDLAPIVLRATAQRKWLPIIHMRRNTSDVGRLLQDVEDVGTYFENTFARSSPNTLNQRATSNGMFTRWHVQFCGNAPNLPPMEELVYEHVEHLIPTKAPATRSQRPTEALSFSVGGQFGHGPVTEHALDPSARCNGKAPGDEAHHRQSATLDCPLEAGYLEA